MRINTLAALGASVAFIAAPAFAQTTNHNTTSTPNQSENTTQQGNTGNARQELVQSLQKAGFTHIKVEPQVFVIHAMNAQGEPVLMRIGPDSMEAVTAMNPHNNNSSSMNGWSQHHASNGNGTTQSE